MISDLHKVLNIVAAASLRHFPRILMRNIGYERNQQSLEVVEVGRMLHGCGKSLKLTEATFVCPIFKS